MKKKFILTTVGHAAFGACLTSCSLVGLHTGGDLHEATAQSYRKGIRAGVAQEVRRAYHAEQQEKERPKPPPQTSYYDVPVPAHVSADGVKIEPHTVPLQIITD